MPQAELNLVATHKLWSRLHHPYNFTEAVGAVFGLEPEQASAVESLLLSTSTEADMFLAAMPSISRSLGSVYEPTAQRCVGEVRGPILWGETMAAWGASGGHEDVMVCAVSERSYDRSENQLLRAVLSLIGAATRSLEPLIGLEDLYVANLVDIALYNAALAQEYLADPRLVLLRPRRISDRQLHRIRFGPLARVYEPARIVYQRHVAGPPLAVVADLLGDESLIYHQKLIAIAEEREASGVVVRPFRVRDGMLSSGTIEFRHPALWGQSDWCGVRHDGVEVP